MCRSIHTLYNIDPPVTAEEIHAASLQFVRKISGYSKPSKANEAAFLAAVGEIEAASARLLEALRTSIPARVRFVEAHPPEIKQVQYLQDKSAKGVSS